jgi:alpha-methylacyl-CoA racemase
MQEKTLGPLNGIRIVELAGIGPAPMAAMLLAELGADVVRVDRVADAGLGIGMPAKYQLLQRSRPSIAVDLKSDEGKALVLDMVAKADGLLEGFRPGVTERLGLGPEHCWARNPALVYGRVTGWGQTGPLAQAAGHDINYIALTGALGAIGRAHAPPTPPLNLVGDFGGGALYLALGVVAALFEARSSGKGQVVDAAMIDGAASLMTSAYGMFGSGLSNTDRGHNILDSGAHFYDVYETSDGHYVSLAPIERKFYLELLERLGESLDDLPHSRERSDWPALKAKLDQIFRQRTRAQWCEILEGTDVCFAPVMAMDEAASHPHNVARDTFVDRNGVVQPNAAPRFSRTPAEIRCDPPEVGANTREALSAWGIEGAQIDALMAQGAIR